jgi:hypothetical protein
VICSLLLTTDAEMATPTPRDNTYVSRGGMWQTSSIEGMDVIKVFSALTFFKKSASQFCMKNKLQYILTVCMSCQFIVWTLFHKAWIKMWGGGGLAAAGQRVLNDFPRSYRMIWFGFSPTPSSPPPPVSKLDRRHTWTEKKKLRKRDNLQGVEGRGWTRSRIIIRLQDCLVLYKSFNILCRYWVNGTEITEPWEISRITPWACLRVRQVKNPGLTITERVEKMRQQF